MDLIAPLARYLIEPIVAYREGSDHLSILSELERSQYASPEEIEQIRLERLKRLLNHAQQNSPFYAKRFAEHDFDPSQVTSLSDLTKLPVIRKADIQRHAADMKATNMAGSILPNQTGGSTGAPLKFFVNRERTFSQKAATWRHDRWAGWDIGRKMGVLWGARVDFDKKVSIKDRLRTCLADRRLILDTSNITPQILADFTEALRSYRPPTYLAYANSMYLFARYLKENNIRDYHRPQGIITSAELLTDPQRALIEEVFECRVFNRYGCRETSIIASECSEHNGLHINAEQVYVEFVRDSGVASKAQPGNIVITDLLNYGMPIIRYQIEDMGFAQDQSCPCGRGLPLMQMAGGRVTDFLITPEGKVISGASMTIYFIATVPGITQAQIIQKQKDHLILKVIKNEKFDNNSLKILKHKVAEFFGPNMKYDLESVDRIPSTASGKHLFSICELDPMQFLC